MTDIDDFLTASGAPAFKFTEIGDTIKGTVTSVEKRDVFKFGTQEPDTWPNGNKKEQLVITVDADGEEFRIFAVKPSAMFAAIREAVAKSGGRFAEGGTLAVKHTGTEPSKTPGYAPRKLFAAKYEPPAPVADVFGDDAEDF